MKKTDPDSELAKTWACSPRTIRNWRKQGAPLSDAKAMHVWLAGQRTTPAGTLAILTSERRKQRAASNAQIAVSPLNKGAAAALSRLEGAEARAHAAAAESEATGNPVEIRAAEVRWLRIASSLLRFDLALEANRRDSGALLPRQEVERLVGGFCAFLRVALRGAIEGACPKLVGVTDPIDALKVLKTVEIDLQRNVLAALRDWMFEQSRFPAWMAQVAADSFSITKEPDSAAQWRRDAFQEFCKQFATFRTEKESTATRTTNVKNETEKPVQSQSGC